ncbi:hypothetical protein [Sphingomonas sp. Leaf20]|uniref:hypothetical protein n=1 Tax=Sphingomonas sp. Leaf20 TaxID=1735685 RepID=UPI0012E149BD|nr:hypothetical protein [Sphingomonas sp. Leaf20]
MIVVVGLLIALIAAAVLSQSVRQIGTGYLLGAAWMVAVSVVLNTASGRVGDPSKYGDELAWMGTGSMDGFDVHAGSSTRDAGQHHVH